MSAMSDTLHCAICNAPATVHLTQIAQGKVTKVHLCEACAAKGGVTEAPVLNLKDLMGGAPSGESAAAKPGGSSISCPSCGMTEAEFNKTARLGCVHCYDLFADNLAALLPRIQSGVTHGGKHPAGAHLHAVRARLVKSRDELQKAVDDEKYEVAAKLRDTIAALEKELEALTAVPPLA